jgi:hypothetical protein
VRQFILSNAFFCCFDLQSLNQTAAFFKVGCGGREGALAKGGLLEHRPIKLERSRDPFARSRYSKLMVASGMNGMT